MGKRRDDDDERKRLEREVEGLRLLAEWEELYRANAPAPGDPRAESLRLADALLSELQRCVHALKANVGAAEAAARLQRMHLALHRAKDEKTVSLANVTSALYWAHWYVKQRKTRATEAEKVASVVEVLRRNHPTDLVGWTDAQIKRVLLAVHFDIVTARVLGELPKDRAKLHTTTTSKNVQQLRRKAK